MNKKIIFFDIDGTILSPRTFTMSESTKSAILQARDNGNLVFINTGRSYAEIDSDIKNLGFDGFICGCGTYIQYHNQDLLKATLSAKECRAIINDLRLHNIEAVLEGTERIYFNAASVFPAIVRQRDHFINYFKFTVEDWDANHISFDKFSLWNLNSSDTDAFLEKYFERFDYIRRDTNFIEVIPKGYSKSTGIEFILSHLNIPLENTYALGDSANDLSMLTYVKHSIGMGNSEDGISEVVSYMTKDVDEDGAAYALKHFGII